MQTGTRRARRRWRRTAPGHLVAPRAAVGGFPLACRLQRGSLHTTDLCEHVSFGFAFSTRVSAHSSFIHRERRMHAPSPARHACLAAVVLLVAPPLALASNTLPVPCTSSLLIAAINQANAESGDTLVLAAGCTYTFTVANNFWYGPNALPAIQSTMTIEGNGAQSCQLLIPATRHRRRQMRFAFSMSPGEWNRHREISPCTISRSMAAMPRVAMPARAEAAPAWAGRFSIRARWPCER